VARALFNASGFAAHAAVRSIEKVVLRALGSADRNPEMQSLLARYGEQEKFIVSVVGTERPWRAMERLRSGAMVPF
jgi:hypothetical protein